MKHLTHTTCLLATICLLAWPGLSPTAGGAAWAQTRLYVDDDAPCPGDGLSWITAFCDLQDALDWAFTHPEVDEIRVAHGTYYPDRGTGIREWTFQLLDDLALNGGYRGLTPCDPNDPNEPNDPNHHDIGACETILSGEIGNPDLTTDNSYHVVTGTGTDSTAIIDGFTITAGHADGDPPHDDGAGFINTGGSPVISNCTFTDNYAEDGAGMLYTGAGADLTLTGCTFTGNSCTKSYAGAWIGGCDTVTVTGCTFSSNNAAEFGGGLTIGGSSYAHVTDCTFGNNSASHQGGGLRVIDSVPLELINCSFDGNSVSTTSSNYGRGGGVYCADVIAHNCTFTGNSATSDGNSVGNSGRGGGLYATSSAVLTESTFADNTATGTGEWGDGKGRGGGLFGNTVTASDCTFTDNAAGADGNDAHWCGRGGGIFAGSTCTVVRCTFTGNSAGYWSGYDYDSNAQGGAICVADNMLEATECEFVNNSVSHAGNWGARGGAVWAAAVGLDECTFTSNSAGGVSDTVGRGGAVFTENGSTTATNCQFEANTADYQGGAMFLYDATDTITDCTFVGNVAVNSGGGAIRRESPDADHGTATSCVFQNNTCGGAGGAIVQGGASLDLDNCTFEGNTAASSGGAIYHDGSCESIVGCIFVNNTAETDGGAILLDDGPDEEGCSPWIVNCSFHGNVAVGYGGALACTDESSPKMVNSILTGNQAYLGGAVYCYNNSNALLADSTFADNTAAIIGGALYIDSCPDVNVDNSILWGNSPNQVTDLQNQVDINCSDIQGGWPYGEGNIDTDPLFVDADGEDDICGTADDDLRLLPDSLCIDAACNTRVPPDEVDLDVDLDTVERTPLDLDLIRRLTDRPGTVDTGVPDPPDYPLVVDMGAYEYGLFGDLDGDCDVDLADLAILLANYGATFVGYDHGDLDCDGDVDLVDLGALLAVYGTTCE